MLLQHQRLRETHSPMWLQDLKTLGHGCIRPMTRFIASVCVSLRLRQPLLASASPDLSLPWPQPPLASLCRPKGRSQAGLAHIHLSQHVCPSWCDSCHAPSAEIWDFIASGSFLGGCSSPSRMLPAPRAVRKQQEHLRMPMEASSTLRHQPARLGRGWELGGVGGAGEPLPP